MCKIEILGFVKIHNDVAVREQYIWRIMKLVRIEMQHLQYFEF